MRVSSRVCGSLLIDKMKRVISLEFALRSVVAEHSERPMYLVFPTFRSPSRAVIDSSRGVSSHVRQPMKLLYMKEKLAGINPMEVVEVWCETKPLDGAFNILLDVGCRVCDAPISAIQAIEATL